MIGIYKITNKVNNKVYIGQSIDIERRWKEHKGVISRNNQILYKAIRKYGIDNFEFEVVKKCEKEELNDLEIKYIKEYNSYVGFENSNGYNMTLGGDGTTGKPCSEETRIKIRDANRGRVRSKEFKEKISNSLKGHKHSKETKEKLSASRKNRIISDEQKEKARQSNLGKKRSQETREKNRKASIGKTYRAKKIECDGIMFNSQKDFAKYCGIAPSYLSQMLKGERPMNKKLKQLNPKVI